MTGWHTEFVILEVNMWFFLYLVEIPYPIKYIGVYVGSYSVWVPALVWAAGWVLCCTLCVVKCWGMTEVSE